MRRRRAIGPEHARVEVARIEEHDEVRALARERGSAIACAQAEQRRCAASAPATPRCRTRGRIPTSRRSSTSTSHSSRSRSRNHCRDARRRRVEGADHEHAPAAHAAACASCGSVTRNGGRARRIRCRDRCPRTAPAPAGPARRPSRTRPRSRPRSVGTAGRSPTCAPRACRPPRRAARARGGPARLRTLLQRVPEPGAVAVEAHDLEARVRRGAGVSIVALVAAVVADELVGRAEVLPGARARSGAASPTGAGTRATARSARVVVGDVLEHLERAHEVEVAVGDVGELRARSRRGRSAAMRASAAARDRSSSSTPV